MTKLTIDIVSDVICPWCYLGKKRLEAALKLIPELEVEIQWHPFLLDPHLPPEGADRDSYMKERFPDQDQLQQVQLHLSEAGKAEGLHFAFDKVTRTPNSMDAHRLIAYAGGKGLQSELVEELFRRYWVEGEDISNHGVLTQAAEAAGLDGYIAHALLHKDEGLDHVREKIAFAQKIGVTSVPTFIFAGQYGVAGAQEPEALAQAIREIVEKTG